jgi:hypothetical protein
MDTTFSQNAKKETSETIKRSETALVRDRGKTLKTSRRIGLLLERVNKLLNFLTTK